VRRGSGRGEQILAVTRAFKLRAPFDFIIGSLFRQIIKRNSAKS
jgi:hypothetical protein